jgi:hypothetical protein
MIAVQTRNPKRTASGRIFPAASAEETRSFFGLSRGWYYKAEKRGGIKMVAVRQRGAVRGVRLVAYDSVCDYIRRAGSNATAGKDVET